VVLTASSTIKYDRSRAVLKLRIGDPIALDSRAFHAISEGFFADQNAKFT